METNKFVRENKMNERKNNIDENLKKAEKIIRDFIEKEGINNLKDYYLKVHAELLHKGVDSQTANIILGTLLSKTAADIENIDKETLSKQFQKECFFQKNISNKLAEMYSNIFSKKNLQHWNDKIGNCLKDFYKKTWEYKWNGMDTFGDIYAGIDYEAYVTAEIKIKNKEFTNNVLSDFLKKNPYITSEKIFEYIANYFSSKLDEDFHEYVTGDDYYPPTVEDYYENAESILQDCCKIYGLELLKFDYDYKESDYYEKRY